MHFLRLKGMCMDEGKWHLFDKAAKLFADSYGLLGWSTSISRPILPPGPEGYRHVVPDAVLDRRGKLHAVDPAPQGRDRLEALFRERYGGPYSLNSEFLVYPRELRFPWKSPSVFDIPLPIGEFANPRMNPRESIEELYGIRLLLDRRAFWGVFLISIREPVVSWAGEMWPFPSKPRAVLRGISERMSSGVTPHAAHYEDGNPRRG